MGPTDHYLGTNVDKFQTENGSVMWATHSAYYCNTDIVNTKKTPNSDGRGLSQYGGDRCL